MQHRYFLATTIIRSLSALNCCAHALGTEETEHFVTNYLTENFSVVANNCNKSSLQARRKLNTRARAMRGGHARGIANSATARTRIQAPE